MTIKSIDVRFFIDNESGEGREVSHHEFEDVEGDINYERHTIFENGVRQICLTKVIEE